MAEVTVYGDFGAPQKIKSATVSIASPSICREVMGPDAALMLSPTQPSTLCLMTDPIWLPSSNQKHQVEFSDIPGSFESNRPFIFYLFVSVVSVKSQIDLLSIESRSRPFLY